MEYTINYTGVRAGKNLAFRFYKKWRETMTETVINENTSDGYHTFAELYEFRKMFNAALFNEWAIQKKYDVHKSKKHNDGTLCFDGEYFIVVAILPTGQISNHYKLEDWELFQVTETEKAKYPFDNHTDKDVIARLKAFNVTKFIPAPSENLH